MTFIQRSPATAPLARVVSIVGLLCFMGPSVSIAQLDPVVVGMGDSIGEGVQSGDSSLFTQPASYLNWVALKIGVPFALPLIQSGPFGAVGDTSNRRRLSPTTRSANLSVSGADVGSILRDRADALSEAEIDSETDLVLFPRVGSQIELAEALNPPLILCWIGNNDVLSAVTQFDQLDASQMTSVADFRRDFTELVTRLGALDSGLVFANIPDVTSIAFLQDRSDLVKLLGTDHGLPAGDFTSLPAVLLIRLGLEDGSILQNPNYVLDSAEAALIQERIGTFNQIIAEVASSVPAPVVDVNALFRHFVASPPVVLGIPLTHKILGGLFSLDGVHPSNIGHIVISDQVLAVINAFYGTSFPRITSEEFHQTFITDPFLDKDGDGKSLGRPFTSLLETIGFLTGFTGDVDDFNSNLSVARSMRLDRDDALRAFRQIWGPRTQ